MASTFPFPKSGHRGLVAWQKAMDLADRVLTLCDRVPPRAGVGLVSQLRRAVVSVPSNIAERYGRPKSEYLSYLRVARGSLREAETQLELLFRRGVLKTETAIELFGMADEIGRVIHGLTGRIGRAHETVSRHAPHSCASLLRLAPGVAVRPNSPY